MATLKELAARTGYSPATISRILSEDASLTVPDETRRRVVEAAEALNYAATKSRRGRTPKRQFRVGIADMLEFPGQSEDPYIRSLHRLTEQACAARHLIPVPMERSEDSFYSPDQPVDGIVALGAFSPEEIEVLRVICPVLVFVGASPDEGNSDSVVVNYRQGITQAINYFASMGHSSIAFAGPQERLDDWKRPAQEERLRLYLELMVLYFLPPMTIETEMNAEAAAGAVGEFLASGTPLPTALLCVNEEVAAGAARAADAAGLSVPRQLSILAFRDLPAVQSTDPPLSTIAVPVRDMAETAVSLLCQRVALGGRPPQRTLPQKVSLPPTLLEGGSVAYLQAENADLPSGATFMR